MSEKARKRVNALDVLVVLLLAAAVTAFCLRGWLRGFFAEDTTHIITYAFRVTDVEDVTADSMKTGRTLYSLSGSPMGEVLTCVSGDATDSRLLPDGRTVLLPNGKVDLSGSVTANGYVAEGFVYLQNGIRLIPGESVTVSTGDAVFTLQITSVQTAEENRSN